MSRYGRSSYGYFSQPSAYELQSMGEEYIRKQAAKGIILHPVCAKSSSRNICQSWWGISWCKNLERYADYANRLARGRKYTRSGAILDLQISKGVVTSIVQGSSARPYKITIRIDPLSDTHLKKLEDTCFNKVKNLDELLAGKFPDDLKNVFFDKDGLFPKERRVLPNPTGHYRFVVVAPLFHCLFQGLATGPCRHMRNGGNYINAASGLKDCLGKQVISLRHCEKVFAAYCAGAAAKDGYV